MNWEHDESRRCDGQTYWNHVPPVNSEHPQRKALCRFRRALFAAGQRGRACCVYQVCCISASLGGLQHVYAHQCDQIPCACGLLAIDFSYFSWDLSTFGYLPRQCIQTFAGSCISCQVTHSDMASPCCLQELLSCQPKWLSVCVCVKIRTLGGDDVHRKRLDQHETMHLEVQ